MKNKDLTLTFTDNKGGEVTIVCQTIEHFNKIKLRYERRGWKQIDIKPEPIKFDRNYPF